MFVHGGATGAALKDRAPAASEYNADHAFILITYASPFLRFPEEFLCWVGISRNYLLNKEMDLNAFIRTVDPRKVRIVERARAENEEPIVTVAKHRTMTPLPTLVVRPFGDLSESVEREFGGDVSGSAGRGQEDASVGGYSDAKPIVPVTAGVTVGTGSSRAKRPKKKSGSVIGGKSPGVLNIRSQDGKDDKDNDKGSKSRSQSMKEQAYNEDKDQEHSSLNDKSNLTDLMKECHQ
ncbi:hypothetical protein Tco_1068109 [Tanacetum coccineum]|uniref:Uncharacterized protein n=1 Tax=Tanacetum coccineum TaxID=301880 RepID=A0ABQ5HGR2_9ASTR